MCVSSSPKVKGNKDVFSHNDFMLALIRKDTHTHDRHVKLFIIGFVVRVILEKPTTIKVRKDITSIKANS